MSNILVTAKVNPDLDGTACTLAYADLLNKTGKKAVGLVTGHYQNEVEYFVRNHQINISDRKDIDSDEYSNFILVDFSEEKGRPKVVKPEKVIEIIDHRQSDPFKYYPQALVQNDLIGAAATIVVERFIQAGLKPQPDHAKLLYGAIYHNTLNFIATNVSQRDKDAVKYLESNYNLSENIIREMFDFATREAESDVQKALESDAKEFGTGCTIGAYQLLVWGNGVFNHKKQIEKIIKDLRVKMHAVASWSFANIIDLEAKKSHIYVSNSEGEEVLVKALGVKFVGGWAELDVILRKQIMAKVQFPSHKR